MAKGAVLTTGANSGIGLATAIELARRGYHSVGGVRSEAKANLLTDAASEAGVNVVLVEPGAFRTGIWDGNQEAVDRHEGSRYATAYQRELLLTRLAQPLMGSPSRVARVIAHALEARLPRARYLVGYDAQALA